MNDNKCVLCGDPVPEGRQVCKICEEVNKEVSDEVELYIQTYKAMKGLLREVQPLLRNAFFAHFEDTKKADELYDRIAEIVGKE